MKTLLPFLLLFLFANCNSKNNPDSEKEDNGQPLCIDLAGNINNTVSSLPLSEAAEKVDIVRLETSDKSLIRSVEDIQVTDHDIFIFDVNEGIFRFSRDGKFLNKISKKGEGPEEYIHIHQIIVDESRKEVYVWSRNKINIFGYDGSFKRLAISKLQEEMFYGSEAKIWLFKQFFFLNDKLPIMYMRDKIWTFALADNNFTPQREYYNPEFKGREEAIKANCGLSYRWKNCWSEYFPAIDFYNQQFKMKYYGVDTVYQFNEQTLDFDPIYTIALGEQPSFEMEHLWIKDPTYFNYLRNQQLYDTKDYTYFLCGKSEQSYTFRFNKTNKEIVTVENDCPIKATPFPGSPNFVHRTQLLKFQLQNDLSGGGDFSVDYKSQGKYWIDECNPSDLLEQIDVDELKTGKVKDEAARDKLVQVLSTIAEDDNPVLFIATLK